MIGTNFPLKTIHAKGRDAEITVYFVTDIS